ncbi:MAG: hypothetical protein QM754_02550 [Tepidisphaeraceae bacterium]
MNRSVSQSVTPRRRPLRRWTPVWLHASEWRAVQVSEIAAASIGLGVLVLMTVMLTSCLMIAFIVDPRVSSKAMPYVVFLFGCMGLLGWPIVISMLSRFRVASRYGGANVPLTVAKECRSWSARWRRIAGPLLLAYMGILAFVEMGLIEGHTAGTFGLGAKGAIGVQIASALIFGCTNDMLFASALACFVSWRTVRRFHRLRYAMMPAWIVFFVVGGWLWTHVGPFAPR